MNSKTLQKCSLFDALVASVWSYSAEVWGFNEAKNTEFLWNIICLNKSTYVTGPYEPHREKTNVLYMRKQRHSFATWIVQYLYFLNPKF